MNINKTWNRCDECGKFIAHKDFDDGATRELISPDSEYSMETWETLCKKHAMETAQAWESIKREGNKNG
jgi:hypothetical protein